jgi:CRISPR-associated endonuclease Cas1
MFKVCSIFVVVTFLSSKLLIYNEIEATAGMPTVISSRQALTTIGGVLQMAATKTVSQLPQSHNSLTPRHGVVTLFGYGIQARVDRGHLLVEDGIGVDRHRARFPRVGHGLRRLVVIGADGMVSFAALRWLADQDAAFVMLDRDGSVLTTTGPVRPSDARLRRAQAMALQTGAALRITRELIAQKLVGQEQVARNRLLDSTTADAIARFRAEVATAESIATIRLLESQGAAAYWSAWRTLPINFPRNDLHRVPDHWRSFGTRISPLSGSPRLAVNPANAMLNYLYALLESEARLAVAALGLDPGIGVLHVDRANRDSLACDLMEPVRPQVDAFVLDWITREPLSRQWFFEQRDGNCRLMAPFAVRLSETVPTWGRAVAPFAEWVAHTLWSTIAKPARQTFPATRLTQRRRREAKGGPSSLPEKSTLTPESICRLCGIPVMSGRRYCGSCVGTISGENLAEVARLGRVAAQSPQAKTRRADTKRRHDAARRGWLPSSQPAWLNNENYTNKIQPRLARITIPAIALAIGVSRPYATDIRAGRCRPHPRHWLALAQLVGVWEDG